MLDKQYLKQRIQQIQTANNYQSKQIDQLLKILTMKRNSENQYKLGLQKIDIQLTKYLNAENGFLTEIIKSYQSFISIVYQNTVALIQGYDNQIIKYLKQVKQQKIDISLLKKVSFAEDKLLSSINFVKDKKIKVRQANDQLQIINTEVTFKGRANSLTTQEKKIYAEKYMDIKKIKEQNQQQLMKHIQNMLGLSEIYMQTYKQICDYQSEFLQKKGKIVFDNMIRAFVLQVSFIRSVEFDVGLILKKIRDKQQEKKKIALEQMKAKILKQKSNIRKVFWDAYKTITKPYPLTFNQNYISQEIKKKWALVQQNFNKIEQGLI